MANFVDESRELFELTFYHQAGNQYVEQVYCVGLGEAQAVMAVMVLHFWRLVRVRSVESDLNNWLHDCYTMEVH